MITEKQRAANQTAFERGQEDVRNARPRNNPYPHISPLFDMYEQGYDAELEVQHK